MRLTWTAVLLLAGAVSADVVHLKDGGKLSGTVQRTRDGWTVTDERGQTTTVSDEQVRTVEKVGTLSRQELAQAALVTLRRGLETVNDAALAVPRLERFVQEYKGTPAATEAQAEMLTWKQRIDSGMVKVGSQWVTPAEHTELRKKTAALVEQAQTMLKVNRLREADAVVEQLLAIDSAGAVGHYLKGVLLCLQEKFGPARKEFEAAKATAPDHAPTLNNLAVVLYRFKQYPAAMSNYAQAMLASPQDRHLLNNVAEALHALPEDQRQHPPMQLAARRFAEQDQLLQQALASQGLYRWGGGWINEKQLAELKKAEAEVKKRLDAITAEYDKLRAGIASLEGEIDANRRAIDRLEASRWVQDTTGKQFLLPRPEGCYRLERANDLLMQDRAAMLRRLPAFKERAAEVQREFPQPRYSGIQQIVGAEGAPSPSVVSAPPATLPTPSPGHQP
jgi:tetratricopeptide (TPR) repeat protein